MTNHPLFTRYLKELSAVTLQGDAREEGFYPALAEIGGGWTASRRAD